MERRKLDERELYRELAEIPDWESEGDAIKLSRKFADFAKALEFVNEIGDLAEAADHHPDITFGWGYADVLLTTHDRGGVTNVDIALAKQIDAI